MFILWRFYSEASERRSGARRGGTERLICRDCVGICIQVMAVSDLDALHRAVAQTGELRERFLGPSMRPAQACHEQG
jgi:hypothetical protein